MHINVYVLIDIIKHASVIFIYVLFLSSWHISNRNAKIMQISFTVYAHLLHLTSGTAE
jgi:hypothetical protein